MVGPFELVVIIAIIIAIISFFTKQKMKEFKVYKHHTKGYKAVKVGIAWLASVFNPIWFLFRGLWSIFISYIIIILILASIDEKIYGFDGYIDIPNSSDFQLIFFIIQIIIFLTPGFKGNEWTSNNLQKKRLRI